MSQRAENFNLFSLLSLVSLVHTASMQITAKLSPSFSQEALHFQAKRRQWQKAGV